MFYQLNNSLLIDEHASSKRPICNASKPMIIPHDHGHFRTVAILCKREYFSGIDCVAVVSDVNYSDH